MFFLPLATATAAFSLLFTTSSASLASLRLRTTSHVRLPSTLPTTHDLLAEYAHTYGLDDDRQLFSIPVIEDDYDLFADDDEDDWDSLFVRDVEEGGQDTRESYAFSISLVDDEEEEEGEEEMMLEMHAAALWALFTAPPSEWEALLSESLEAEEEEEEESDRRTADSTPVDSAISFLPLPPPVPAM